MSDAPQGPGWWQASDDKWYPPPRPAMPGEDETAMAAASAPPAGVAPPAGPSGPSAGYPSGPGYGAPPGVPSGPGYGPGVGPPMGAGAYGAPGGPPPGGGQNRTPLIVALVVVAVLAVVGIGIVATSGGDDDENDPIARRNIDTTAAPTDDTEDTATDETVTDTTESQSGSQGAIEDIEVTDSGVTNFPDEFDGTNRASYAYVLTNNGDEPVANMEVTVTLVDTEGTVLSSDTDSIYLLQPGQSLGLGDTTYDEIAEVDSIEVQPAIPSYASEAEQLGEVTVEGINTTADSSGYLTTTFTATSSYEVQLDSPWGYVVYRNADGGIVGGTYSVIDIVQPGGSTSGEVATYTAIPNVDPAQTEVYVDPGYL
ncbi:MAG TPA: FxLYD domain-containing protein [Acidimicrobiales bacterium]|nr:FxLYD domain-containing protein [Acidimicrobiales bacterium]